MNDTGLTIFMSSADAYEKPIRPRSVLLAIFLVGLLILSLWMGWFLRDLFIMSKNLRNQSRFDQIENLLRGYHEQHGAFPPTRFQPVPGGPIHSWRVLLVTPPTYDFSQRWDSTNNLRVSRFRHFTMIDHEVEIAHYLTDRKSVV